MRDSTDIITTSEFSQASHPLEWQVRPDQKAAERYPEETKRLLDVIDSWRRKLAVATAKWVGGRSATPESR